LMVTFGQVKFASKILLTLLSWSGPNKLVVPSKVHREKACHHVQTPCLLIHSSNGQEQLLNVQVHEHRKRQRTKVKAALDLQLPTVQFLVSLVRTKGLQSLEMKKERFSLSHHTHNPDATHKHKQIFCFSSFSVFNIFLFLCFLLCCAFLAISCHCGAVGLQTKSG